MIEMFSRMMLWTDTVNFSGNYFMLIFSKPTICLQIQDLLFVYMQRSLCWWYTSGFFGKFTQFRQTLQEYL